MHFSLVNAVKQQASYAAKLAVGPLENYNILENSYAFWCFFNGNQAIRNTLDNFSQKFIDNAEKSKKEIVELAYTFAS